ncbi:hypothetical protein DFQ27_004761 [Actinomortierella ambigua]|uniref:Alcohol acetyltransferase n=1 Tax=Actinomortierella ambigua TaxID=1343610 RepID=A0A9P6U3N2_9FUNG|nr:hypothetical protein DFQ27_004761 [Actinomortierella ambigua]
MASTKHTLPEVRALHHLERYMVSRGNIHAFYNVIAGPRIRPTANNKSLHPSTDNSLDWATFLARPLTWLIQEHPTLSVVVRDHLSNAPWFVRLPSVDLAKIVRVATVQNPEDVSSILEEEHNMPFDLADWSVPMWRIIVVRVVADGSFYLLYNFHHAIGDGRSAMALTEQLHEQVNLAALHSKDTTTASTPLIVPSPDNKPMYVPIELRIDCRPRFKTLTKEVIPHLLFPRALKRALATKYWAGDVDAKADQKNISQLARFQLTAQETAMVVQAAKKRQNTVQSVFHAAAVFAVQSCFIYPSQLTGDAIDPAQRYSTPIAMRDLLPLLDEKARIARTDQGTYTAEALDNVVLRPESSFWKVAKDYRRDIVKATQTREGVRGLLEHGGMLNYVPNHNGGWEEFFQDQYSEEQHGRRATMLISNLGRGWPERPLAAKATKAAKTAAGQEGHREEEEGDQQQQDTYEVEDAIFSQSAETIGMTFSYSVATANGVLTATNTWQASAFHSRDRGEWYTRETKRILLQACQADREDLSMQQAFDACEPRP